MSLGRSPPPTSQLTLGLLLLEAALEVLLLGLGHLLVFGRVSRRMPAAAAVLALAGNLDSLLGQAIVHQPKGHALLGGQAEQNVLRFDVGVNNLEGKEGEGGFQRGNEQRVKRRRSAERTLLWVWR